MHFIPSTKEGMFSPMSVCLFVGLSAGLHKKTLQRISTKPRFGMDPDKGIDLGALAEACALQSAIGVSIVTGQGGANF